MTPTQAVYTLLDWNADRRLNARAAIIAAGVDPGAWIAVALREQTRLERALDAGRYWCWVRNDEHGPLNTLGDVLDELHAQLVFRRTRRAVYPHRMRTRRTAQSSRPSSSS